MKFEIKESDVLNCIEEYKLYTSSRKTIFTHKRFFIISILYHYFNWVDEDIAPLFNLDRSTITQSKYKANELWTDKLFIENTKELRNIFPTWYPPKKGSPSFDTRHKYALSIAINKSEYAKLDKVRDILKVRNLGTVLKTLAFKDIDKIIKDYDEQNSTADPGPK